MRELLAALTALSLKPPYHFVGSVSELHAALTEVAPEGAKLPAERSLLKQIAAIGAGVLRERRIMIRLHYRHFLPVVVLCSPSTSVAELLPGYWPDEERIIGTVNLIDGTRAVAREFIVDGGGRGISVEHLDASGRRVEVNGLPSPTLPADVWAKLLPQISEALSPTPASPSATGGTEADAASSSA